MEIMDWDMTRQSVLPHWNLAREHLLQKERKFSDLFRQFPGEGLTGSGDPFRTLGNAIVGQQISVKAAQSIWKRVEALVPRWTPEAVVRLREEELRTAGLSWRKVAYMQDLARGFLDGRLDPEKWAGSSDEEIIRDLVGQKGIGRWTAEMFLIFHLHRPDVLPLDDIGLLKAAAGFYGEEGMMEPRRLEILAQPWRPWRTVAVWYLWRSLDPHPVSY